MKKISLVVVAVLLMLPSTIAFADDTKVTLGVRAWQNSWEEKVEYKTGGSDTYNFGSAMMVGPTLNIKFSNQMFAGATYLMTTKDYSANNFAGTGTTTSASRSDTDVAVGYMFTPQFGMFVGYKSLNADLSATPAGSGKVDIASLSLKGPGIGILGNIPLGESFALYGNLSLMFMNEEIKSKLPGGGTHKMDMAGASMEIGVAFAFTSSLSANLGIKSQAFSGEDEDTKDTVTESFVGATFGVTYMF